MIFREKNFKKNILLTLLFLELSLTTFAQINTDNVISVGRNALYRKDYFIAISYFNKVIRIKPYLAEPYYLRAYAKYSLDDFKGAEKDMDKAIDINPFISDFYSFRADILTRQNNLDKALKDYQSGLNIDPENIAIYFKRGIAYLQNKKYAESVRDYNSVIKLDNSQYGAFINRAIAKLNLKDTIGSIKDVNEAIEINPIASEPYRFSAVIYYEINDFENAYKRINKAIELDDSHISYYMIRSYIRYQQDDLKGTMADYNKVIELDCKNKVAYFNRGVLRGEIGDLNNAVDDFSRVLALDSKDLLALYNRAILYLKIKNYYKAISDLNIIIDHYPKYVNAFLARSEAYNGLGNKRFAQLDYNNAIKLKLDEDRKVDSKVDTTKNSSVHNNKPKKTRDEDDEDINNYNKIVVLDDFEADSEEQEDLESLQGKIQNKNIVIDLEPSFGLTFFTEDSLINRTRYFKPSVTQFNKRKNFGRPLVFSNREIATDDEHSKEYFKTIENIENYLSDENQDEAGFIKGILYSVVFNYNNAIDEYNKIINNSDKKDLKLFAYFNLAYVRYKTIEIVNYIENKENIKFDNVNIKLNNFSNVNNNSKTIAEKNESKLLDYKLIENDLKNVIELDSTFEFAYYNLAIIECEQKHYEQAIEYFSKAIELNPLFAEAYFNRGLTRIYLKQKIKGSEDLSKAGELGLYKAYNIMKRYGVKYE